MFVDKVSLKAKAGNGGNGLVSFRRERYISKGGPDGGDGGNGGDIIFEASNDQNTLAAFRYKKLIKSQDGFSGGQAKKHGKAGNNLVIKVPVGTTVTDESGELICDLTNQGQSELIAKGGKGGFGNAHFTSSVRQAPKVAEKGEEGQARDLILELKMIADVGLVGLPNAGKSSLLAAVSNARPEIADYPFTTLIPHLGVSDIDGQSILIADIPGLIEGASHGRGLGDEFLKHISRCKVLLHLIDSANEDVANSYKIIRQEIEAYSVDLAKKPEIIALTKCENISQKELDNRLLAVKKLVKDRPVLAISSYAKRGLDELLYKLQDSINSAKEAELLKTKTEDSIPVIKLNPDDQQWTVKKIDTGFLIKGQKIEKFAERTDFNNTAGVERLLDIIKKMGILQELNNQEIVPGDKLIFGDPPKGEMVF